MKNVCSYCLFVARIPRDAEGYWVYLPALIRAHHVAFPDWTLRVYHDNQAMGMPDSELLKAYAAQGLVELVYAGEENFSVCRSMLWRMKALWDESVGYVLCRDVDSMPSFRERRCVDEFVNCGAVAHCISECESHTSLMMGGMCGFHAPRFREVTGFQSWDELIALGVDLHDRNDGPDQKLLNKHVWPRVRPYVCEHRLLGLPTHTGLWLSSAQVPDIPLKNVNPELAARLDSDKGDDLCCYIGAAGYRVKEVVRIVDEFGPPELLEKIWRAENR